MTVLSSCSSTYRCPNCINSKGVRNLEPRGPDLAQHYACHRSPCKTVDVIQASMKAENAQHQTYAPTDRISGRTCKLGTLKSAKNRHKHARRLPEIHADCNMLESSGRLTIIAGSRPRANLIFSGQVSMSLFRRMARMPLLQEKSPLSTFHGTITL